MLKLYSVLKSSRAAIDLASIMVGVIIIGLIGGVIAATVFAVIPWSQDKAAKQQLDSVHTAQNAFYGLSSDPSQNLVGGKKNSFGGSVDLASNNLLSSNPSYCTVATTDGKDYHAYSKSASGKTFYALNSNKQAQVFTGSFPCITDANGIVVVNPAIDNGSSPVGTTPGTDTGTTPVTPTPEVPALPEVPDSPATTTTTQFTINCPTGVTTAQLPWSGVINGTETWSDGTKQTYASATVAKSRNVTAGTTYTVVLDGTFTALTGSVMSGESASCIRSMDTWGSQSGTTSMADAFYSATNLTSVPTQLPSTVTVMSDAFRGASSFNSPNVTKWNTANITDFNRVFFSASSFNQPIGNWNISKVNPTGFTSLFYNATSFNQNVNNWDVSRVTNLSTIFRNATSFNQPLDKWNTANATNFTGMFNRASAFNQDISGWNTNKMRVVTDMFIGATSFNQPIGTWNVSSVASFQHMFNGATSFNQPLNNWTLTSATSTYAMFLGATSFNQPLDKWNTSTVTNMSLMFQSTTSFNQNISGWNVGAVTTYTDFKTGSALTNAQVPAKMRT